MSKTQASSSNSPQKIDTCVTNLIELSRKHFDCDTSWNTSMPYPTWPFTRVRGTELEKGHKMAAKKSFDEIEEALL
jgi:hypothetical protein